MTATHAPWSAGQQVAHNRTKIMTIDRVTPSGRAKIGDLTFTPAGWGYGPRTSSASRIEPLTGEVVAAMELHKRASGVAHGLFMAAVAVHEFNATIRPMRDRDTIPADVAKAERLLAAINAVLKVPNE